MTKIYTFSLIVFLIILLDVSAYAAPVITNVQPEWSYDVPVNIDIQGSGFEPFTPVKVVKSGSPDINPDSLSNTDTNIFALFNLSNATGGIWTLVGTNPSDNTTFLSSFTVKDYPSNVVASPSTADNNGVISFTLTGENFHQGATVWITKGISTPSGITPTNVNIVNSTHITFDADLTGIQAGNYWIHLQNPTGPEKSDAFFSVYDIAKPRITSYTPSSGAFGSTVTVDIYGRTFLDGLTVILDNYEDPHITGNIIERTNEHVRVTFDISSIRPGLYNLILTNPDSNQQIVSFTVTTNAVQPAITSLSPSLVFAEPITIQIQGSDLNSAADVRLKKDGKTDVVAESVQFLSSNQINATFNLSSLSSVYDEVEPWNLVVQNPDFQTAEKSISIDSCLRIYSVSPASVDNNAIQIFTLNGKNFKQGATIALYKSGGSLTSCPVSDLAITTQQVTFSANLNGITAGTYNFRFTNPGGDYSNTDSFTLNDASSPVISTYTPSEGNVGSTVDIVITGIRFGNPSAVSLTTEGGTTLTANPVTYTESGNITARFDLSSAIEGMYYLKVTNGSVSSALKSFNVFDSPGITSVSPSGGTPSEAQKMVTITGSNFKTGTTVQFTQTGQSPISGTNISVVSSTQITTDINLSSATMGQWNVVVTNPNSRSVTLPNAFTVSQNPPVVTGISPLSEYNNKTAFSFTLTGSNILGGATIRLEKSGQTPIIASGVTVSSSTTATGLVNLSKASPGPWNINLTNPDGQYNVIPNGFTITGTPEIVNPTPQTLYINNTQYVDSFLHYNYIGTIIGARLVKDGISVDADSIEWWADWSDGSKGYNVRFNTTDIPYGVYDYSVWDGSGTTITMPDFVTLTHSQPTITDWSPLFVNLDNPDIRIAIAGNADEHCNAVLERNGVTLNSSFFTSNNGNNLASFDIHSLTAGNWNLSVVAPDGKRSNPVLFKIYHKTVRISSVTPDSGTVGGLVHLTVTGTNLSNGYSYTPQLWALAGEPYTINGTNVQIINENTLESDFDLTSSPTYLYDIRLFANLDGGPQQVGSNESAFQAVPGYPTISSITPEGAIPSVPFNLTIYGNHFASDTEVYLISSSNIRTQITSPTLISQEQITCLIPGLSSDTYAVEVRKLSWGNESVLPNALTIGYGTPTITSISPEESEKGSSVTILINGTNFVTGSTVKLSRNGVDIQGTVESVHSDNLTADFSLGLAEEGLWNVIVTLPDQTTATFPNGFTIKAALPVISSVSPNTGSTAHQNLMVNISGSRLELIQSVKLITEGTTPIESSIVGRDSGTLFVRFDLTQAIPGEYNLTAITSEGGSVNSTFTIVNTTPPSLTSLSPIQGIMGENTTILINGTSFENGASVDIYNLNYPHYPRPSVSGTVFLSSESLSATVDTTGAEPGQHAVYVRNPNGVVSSNYKTFTVQDLGLLQIFPNYGLNNQSSINVTIKLSKTISGSPSVTLEQPGGYSLSGSNISVSGDEIRCDFALNEDLLGLYDLRIVDSNPPGNVYTFSKVFTFQKSQPWITSVSPNNALNNADIFVTIHGGGLAWGNSVTLEKTGNPSIQANLESRDTDSINCTFQFRNADPGIYDVVVTYASGERVVFPGGFQISTPLNIYSINPESASADTKIHASIYGTGFIASPIVSFRQNSTSSLITPTNVTVIDTNTIECDLNLTDVTSGLYDLVIQNGDGRMVQLENCFTVTAPTSHLTLTSISPDTAINSTYDPILVHVLGTGFLEPAPTVILEKSDNSQVQLNVVSTDRVSSERLDISISLGGMTAGTYDLTVINPGQNGERATLDNAFTLTSSGGSDPTPRPTPNPEFSVTTLDPAIHDNSANITVLIKGTGFIPSPPNGPPIGVVLGNQGNNDIIGEDVVCSGGDLITAILPLLNASPGEYDVTVTLSDGNTTTLNKGFTVVNSSNPYIIWNINPNSASPGGDVPVIISWTGYTYDTNLSFKSGLSITLSQSAGPLSEGLNISAKNIQIVNNSYLTCVFPLQDAPSGPYNIKINNVGFITELNNSFLVEEDIPPSSITITSVTPVTGSNLGNVVMQIEGTGFSSSMEVILFNDGTSEISEPVYIPGTGFKFISPTKISCTMSILGKPPGNYKLIVRNKISGDSGEWPSGFEIISPKVNITSITPESSSNDGIKSITINGENFRVGSTVLLQNQTLNITGAVTSFTPTQLKCTFPLSGVPSREWDLTISNIGISTTAPHIFTTTYPYPTITSVSPTPVFTTTDTNLTITGTNFRTGVTAILTNSSLISDNLTGTNLIKTGTTKIQYTFPTEGQPAGKYNLTVTNIDGTTITSPNIFELKSPSSDPNITLTTPCIGKNNAALPITITGSNFRGPTATTFTGISVTLENETLGTTFTGTPTTGKVQKSNQLFYTLPLNGKPAGIYNLTVRNYDGSSFTNTSGFIITTTNPTVSAISPAIGYTTKDQPVTLTGTNFRTGAGVTLTNGSISYNGTGVTVASPASLTCTFPLLTLPEDVTPGTYNVTVTNADGASGTKTGAFTITTPVNSPVITKISPTSGLNNAGAPVTITGKNFLKPTVTITNDTMSRTAKATTGKTQSTTIIYYTLPLTGLEPGSYRVNVTNQYGLNATISFPVNPTKPTITKISPVLGYTTGDTPITISGTNYRAGAEVNLSNATTRLLATSTVVTPTTITCSFPTTGMTTGTYNLTVTNTDGTNVTKPSGFTVKNPGFLPTITGISPNTSANSGARAVTITGTNLSTTGALVKISTDGYPDFIGTPTTGKTQTASRLYYTLPLTGVPDGKYNLTVINKDGLEVTRSEFFTVTASKPSIAIDSTTKKEKISPVSAFNTSPVNITITGTNFRNGVQVNLTNMSAVVEGQVITRTNTQIVSQFSLSGIPAGKYNLTIRNTDGTNVTAKTLFIVKKPGIDPVISSITPASAFNTGNLAVTITGKYFNKPAVYLTQGELTKTATATAKKVSTTTTLYVTLPLTGVPGGLYNLKVRNADGASTTAEGIFWVTDKASVSSVRTSPVVGNSPRMPVTQVPQIVRPAGMGTKGGPLVVVPQGPVMIRGYE